MEEFKGTRGPWIFSVDEDDICDNGLIKSESGSIVCYFGNMEQYYPTSGEPPNGDDMSLILASPDILSALQQLLEIYDDHSGKVWTTSSKRRALDNARAAVNKALGETK
jgi:hypothetical protein